MGDVSLEPYIFFEGNCKEAMEFYKNVFGGELTIQTFGDLPEGVPTMPGSKPTEVMNCSLKGGAIDMMAADSPKASPKSAKVELALTGTDETAMRKIFEVLAEDGKVSMNLAKQFWGDIFGSLTDKYGVDWMMNIGTNA